MASDSRYIYHHPQEPPANPYPYPYPYENGQYAQGPSRPPVRSPPPSQPVQHPPPPASYNSAPPTYPSQPGYPPPAYAVPPQPPQQWQGEWSHYPYPHPPPLGQPQYPPPAGARPDLSPSTPNEDRRYAQQPPRQDPQPRRTEERPPPQQRPEAAPPPPPPPSAPVRKSRDNEPPAPAPAPQPPVSIPAQVPAPPPAPAPPAAPSHPPNVNGVGIDFVKLVESYRLILDSANTLSYEATPARPTPPAETLERMLQAAAYGAQVLDAAAKRAAPEPPRPATDRTPEDGEGEANRARQGENQQPATEGQTCLGCSATSTPEWRRGPMGPRTLCNACGLVYAKLIKKRNRNEPGRGRTGGQAAKSTGQIVHGPIDDQGGGGGGASSGEGEGDGEGEGEGEGEGASDDDDSYGSQQDRRSDMGYRGGGGGGGRG